jgi:hypothetical protein
MVDVTNRPDVAVRLRPLKLRLRHDFRLSFLGLGEHHPVERL